MRVAREKDIDAFKGHAVFLKPTSSLLKQCLIWEEAWMRTGTKPRESRIPQIPHQCIRGRLEVFRQGHA